MAYEKHTWETGETITAEKLNNLEDGVSGNTIPVHFIPLGSSNPLDGYEFYEMLNHAAEFIFIGSTLYTFSGIKYGDRGQPMGLYYSGFYATSISSEGQSYCTLYILEIDTSLNITNTYKYINLSNEVN